MRFTCPYCFEEMTDEEVLFRSEKVNQGDNPALPLEYADREEFDRSYNEPDKEDILEEYDDWEFFAEGDDEVYEAFWRRFQGTTEKNPADDKLGVKAYRRRIIDPANQEHQRYLLSQADGSYWIRDAQGMVAQIQLNTPERELCHRRVCPHCHNPLPDTYGKSKVNFAVVIGITGSGKTVYISQLLKNLERYAARAGLDAVKSPNVSTFLDANPIRADAPLPGSTPAGRFQQPLFYQIIRNAEGEKRVTETFVLYDVAGEALTDSALIPRYAPFIEHADGMIMLLDPLQFQSVCQGNRSYAKLDDPKEVLDQIHNIVSQADDRKCDIPLAVCLSQIDLPEVQTVLETLVPGLSGLLKEDVSGELDENGDNKPLFNARQYNPIADKLSQFIRQDEPALAMRLRNNYSTYAYFAFSALGCEVETGVDSNGAEYRYPVGPVGPKRVEEPLLWLFHKLGYIGVNEPLFSLIQQKIYCPFCGYDKTELLPPGEQYEIVRSKTFPFKKEKQFANRLCLNPDCRRKWEYNP